MGTRTRERRCPGDDLLAGWSDERVEEEFRALVATLLDTLTDVVRPGPPSPAPPRPRAAAPDRTGERRAVRRQRSPPR